MNQTNPHKTEYVRRQMQMMAQATAAKTNALDRIEQERKARSDSRRRRDTEVVRCMVSVVDHTRIVAANGTSAGSLLENVTYRELKWLIDLTLAAADAPAGIRDLARRPQRSSHGRAGASGTFSAAGTALGYMEGAAAVAKNLADPRVASYVSSLLALNKPLGVSATAIAKGTSAIMTTLGKAAPALGVAAGAASVATAAGQGLVALSVRDRMKEMASIGEHYAGHCECCDAAKEISLGLMACLTGATYDMLPMVGLGHVIANVGSDAAHHIYKKAGGKWHRPTYYIARALWQAARSPGQAGYRHCGVSRDSSLSQVRSGHGCPLAYLLLATLSGSGNPYGGIRKATAAALADEREGVDKIKRLVAHRFGCVFARGMDNRIGSQAAAGASWRTP